MTREFFPDKPDIGAALAHAKSPPRSSRPLRGGLPETNGQAHDGNSFAYFDAWIKHRKKIERRWLCFGEIYQIDDKK